MRLNVTYSLIFILGIALHSCTSNTHNNINTGNSRIDVDFSQTSDSLYLSTFVDSVENKYLVLPDSLFIGEASQIYVDSAGIFIVDRKWKCIFHFDNNGHFVNKIDRLGEGPEEYLFISNFWIWDKELYIEDNRSEKINIYTSDGMYKRTIKCDGRFSDIAMVSDSSFLCFTPYFVYDNPVGVWEMDRDGKIKKEVINYGEYPAVGLFWKYFYQTSDGKLGLFSPVTHSFMTYQNDTLITTLEINSVQPTIASFPGISDGIMVKKEFYVPGWYIDGKNWLFSCYGRFREGEPSYLLYSKTDNEVYVYKNIIIDIGNARVLGMPIHSNLPNGLVTLLSEDDLMGSNISVDFKQGSSLLLQIYRMK